MEDTKLRKVFYGKKTFHVVETFEYQGVMIQAGNLFDADMEMLKKYSKCLGELYIPKEKVKTKEEPKKEVKLAKKEEKKIDVKSKSQQRRTTIQKSKKATNKKFK